jgi:hypothetical protein
MQARHRASLLATAIACAALLCAGQASAASATGPDYGYAAADVDGVNLKPGEFTWLSDARSGEGPVTMLVSLRDQRGYLYRDGRRIAVTTVSTGTPGHDTPTGVFPISEKKPLHHSKKYENAPMPWMQRLTQWGHALHAGHVRAGPASHGCVRLPAEFARQLYSLTNRGDLVVIAQDTSPASLARAALVSRSAVMMAAAPVSTEQVVYALRSLGEPAPPQFAAETGGRVGVTSF